MEKKITRKLEDYLGLVIPQPLAEDERIRIVAMNGDRTATAYLRSFDEIRKFKDSHACWNVYLALSTSKEDSGTSDALYRRQVIMLDFDKKDYPKFNSWKDFANLIKERIGDLYYHAILDTGGGYHFYYVVQTTKDCQRVASINRDLAELVGADIKAASSTQIDRLPGSRNHKYDPPKPVNVIVNTFGTPNLKPYSLSKLDHITSKAKTRNQWDEEVKQQPPVDCNTTKAFYCVEAMIAKGAAKGERNFCLGRICNYLRDIKGYTSNAAYETVQLFNARCSPPKSERELKDQFNRYWSNTEYRLLGCTLNNPDKAHILSRYCDKSLCHNSTVISSKEIGDVIEEAPYILMSNRLLERKNFKKLRGNHYLILTLLHYRCDGLTKKELVYELTPRRGKPVMCLNTLSMVLEELEDQKYVTYEKGSKRYCVNPVAGFNRGRTQYFYAVALTRINGVISQTEYLVYLALVKQLQGNKDASYEQLSILTGIDKSSIGKYVNALEDAHLLYIGKLMMENGGYRNSYQLRA